MANTSAVYARIDSGLKENAEQILQQLGITPSSAIQMLYSRIVLTRGLSLANMTREELDAALQRGMDSLKSHEAYSADQVDRMLAEEFGI